jgi:hypothetical protein
MKLTLECNKASIKIPVTKRRGKTGYTAVSYSGGPALKFQSGDQITWRKLVVVFFSPSRKMLGQYLKLGQDRFFQHTSQYSLIIRRYVIMRYWQGVK